MSSLIASFPSRIPSIPDKILAWTGTGSKWSFPYLVSDLEKSDTFRGKIPNLKTYQNYKNIMQCMKSNSTLKSLEFIFKLDPFSQEELNIIFLEITSKIFTSRKPCSFVGKYCTNVFGQRKQ